jgi:hypothetical protein
MEVRLACTGLLLTHLEMPWLLEQQPPSRACRGASQLLTMRVLIQIRRVSCLVAAVCLLMPDMLAALLLRDVAAVCGGRLAAHCTHTASDLQLNSLHSAAEASSSSSKAYHLVLQEPREIANQASQLDKAQHNCEWAMQPVNSAGSEYYICCCYFKGVCFHDFMLCLLSRCVLHHHERRC